MKFSEIPGQAVTYLMLKTGDEELMAEYNLRNRDTKTVTGPSPEPSFCTDLDFIPVSEQIFPDAAAHKFGHKITDRLVMPGMTTGYDINSFMVAFGIDPASTMGRWRADKIAIEVEDK